MSPKSNVTFCLYTFVLLLFKAHKGGFIYDMIKGAVSNSGIELQTN